MLRLRDVWRALKTVCAEPDDPQQLAEMCFQQRTPGKSEGHAYIDFSFGNVARFRAMAFGFPKTTMLLFSRLDGLPPASPIGAPNRIGPLLS
jgi:hypothetical protein